jgi:hypothetical protein
MNFVTDKVKKSYIGWLLPLNMIILIILPHIVSNSQLD